MKFDPRKIKKDFPILTRRVHGKPLVYLDNASTTQKPKGVLDTLEQYYRTQNANIHRGVHTLSEEATESYEAVRHSVADFIGADPGEVVFTRNATEAINLVARTWGAQNIKRGDTILLTEMEHHSNLLPWKWLSEIKNANLAVIPVTDDGRLNLRDFKLQTSNFKLLSVSHMSNVLGTLNPVEKLARWAHTRGALILVDGAQSVAHIPVNVRKLGCDFFVFSGHKIGGPTGIGVLWARKELLEQMDPFLYGGDMVKSVSLIPERSLRNGRILPWRRRATQIQTTWNDTPYKFEAGTPNIAGAIGLGAAVEYLKTIGMKNVHRYITELTGYAIQKLNGVVGVNILGQKNGKTSQPGHPERLRPRSEESRDLARGGVISFTVDGIHPHDLATILDRDGIAIRSGHHCAMPLHERFGLSATARASFWIYNTTKDVEALVGGIKKAQKIFAGPKFVVSSQ